MAFGTNVAPITARSIWIRAPYLIETYNAVPVPNFLFQIYLSSPGNEKRKS